MVGRHKQAQQHARTNHTQQDTDAHDPAMDAPLAQRSYRPVLTAAGQQDANTRRVGCKRCSPSSLLFVLLLLNYACRCPQEPLGMVVTLYKEDKAKEYEEKKYTFTLYEVRACFYVQ